MSLKLDARYARTLSALTLGADCAQNNPGVCRRAGSCTTASPLPGGPPNLEDLASKKMVSATRELARRDTDSSRDSGSARRFISHAFRVPRSCRGAQKSGLAGGLWLRGRRHILRDQRVHYVLRDLSRRSLPCLSLLFCAEAYYADLPSLFILPGSGSGLVEPRSGPVGRPKCQHGGPLDFTVSQQLLCNRGVLTLVYEMYFYIVFAVTLCFARPAISLFGTSAVIFVLFSLSGVVPDEALRHFLGNPIAAEFCLGLLLAYLSRRRPNFMQTAGMLWVPGLALLVVAPLIEPHASTHFPANPARLLWGLSAFLIVASFLSLSPSSAPFRRLTLLLGDASYAIYLTHPLTLISYTLLLKGGLANVPQWPIIPVVIVLCAACGVIVHVFVERRLLDGVRSFFSRDTASALGSAPIPRGATHLSWGQ